MFIDEYLPQNLDKIVYLDADVICNENPINILNQKFEEITDLKYAIGVFTTPITKAKDPEIFNRLQISSKYFNAGVMMIDLKMWNEKNISENLLLTLQKLDQKIVYWDQDVLNSYFDGNYYEIDKNLNFIISSKTAKNNLIEYINKNTIYFIHYAGSNKPWTIEGGINLNSNFYHNYFEKINENKYHIVNSSNRFASIKFLLKSVISLQIFEVKRPARYFFEALKSLFVSP